VRDGGDHGAGIGGIVRYNGLGVGGVLLMIVMTMRINVFDS